MNFFDQFKLRDLLNDEPEQEVIPILSSDEEFTDQVQIPEIIPILPLRNTVLFPGVILPITIGREKSAKLVRSVYKGNKMLGTVSQINSNIDDPSPKDLFLTGTFAQILKILEMPDNSTTVIIQGKARFRIDEFVSEDPFFMAKVTKATEIIPDKTDNEFTAIIGSLKDLTQKIINLSNNIPPEASFAIKNIEHPLFLVNYISSNTNLVVEAKQEMLEIDDLKKRGIKLLEHLSREIKMLELKNDIQTKVKADLDRQQREFLLNQQMKTIQNELGGNPVEQEINELKNRAKKKKWNKEVKEFVKRETEKLNRLNPVSPEYSVQLNFINTLLELPWNEYTTDNFDLKRAKEILDRDHFGLEKIKERILEHLAVLKLKGDMKSPIICLYGPPGVGKTSLGKSVAESLGRKYIRMSLGGLHDEAEIRGHRKTYIGAMPGRIIQSLKKAKSANPVFILDEIDKIGKDFHGDPASALLEVLDPEQNFAFHDNFIEIEFDLSKVMFIATANQIATISPALRDRMEMIEVNGYIAEEKIEIAKRHLVPKQLENHGMKNSKIVFPNKTISYIIENHTRESGVRTLDKKIASIVRQIAKKMAMDEPFSNTITVEDVKEYLGVPEYNHEKTDDELDAGIVNGLAWTETGGEILFIESSLSKGNGKLTLTGNLGEVMKESAVIAHEFLKAHAAMLKIDDGEFEKWNVHIHVPEGAIPKDGPSAGVAMVTSLASSFTKRKVKKRIAMTGEITLRGKVLPVGGIKEKILAAKRAGIKQVILSKQNKKDIDEIKEIYRKGLEFVYVDTIAEVIELSLD